MKLLFSILIFVFTSLESKCQEVRWSVAQTEGLIRVLANDSLQGRKAGSPFEKKALNCINAAFYNAFKVHLKKQKFEVFLQENDKLDCSNGYAFFNKRKKRTVVVSAHYDHIGLGGALSKAATSIKVHNGADDNASGVAAVFHFVDYYLATDCDFNLLVVFYSAHEIGLYGAQHFYPFMQKRKFKELFLHINFDMVGRFDSNKREMRTSYSAGVQPAIPTTFYVDTVPTTVITSVENKLEQLDTKWSYLDKLNCVNITTGIHVDYHTPSDDVEFINFEGIRVAAQLAKIIATNYVQ